MLQIRYEPLSHRLFTSIFLDNRTLAFVVRESSERDAGTSPPSRSRNRRDCEQVGTNTPLPRQTERVEMLVPAPPPPVKSRRIPPTTFATTTRIATSTPTVISKAKATIPRSTHSGHQRRSSLSTRPCIDCQALLPARDSGCSRRGSGGGLPSISRTSASMVSGTAASVAQLPGRAIRRSGRSWNHRLSL